MKKWLRISFIVFVLMLMCSPSFALYHFGMYGENSDMTIPGDLVDMGGNKVVVAYDDWQGNGDWDTFLDKCSDEEIKCIISLSSIYPYDEDHTTDTMKVALVAATKNHDAVQGYSTYDEPHYDGYSVTKVVNTYNAVLNELGPDSDKVVYISFAYGERDKIASYQNGFSVPIVNCYRLHDRNDESSSGEFDEFVSGWSPKSHGVGAYANYLLQLSDAVEDAGKTDFLMAPQAQAAFTIGDLTQRLATPEEMRFQMYFPLLAKHSDGIYANGIISYAYHKAEDTPARPGNPYSSDGDTWLDNVYTGLCQEMQEYIPALAAGVKTGSNGVSDNQSDVHAQLFQTGSTRYVIATNGPTNGTENTIWGADRMVDYTLGSSVPQYNCAEIRNDIAYSSTVSSKYHGPYNNYCAFIERDRTFRDTLSPYQVRAYKLRTATSFNLMNRNSGKALRPYGGGTSAGTDISTALVFSSFWKTSALAGSTMPASSKMP